MGLTEITKEFRFEAAHFLPNVPEGHKCGRMHGHSFKFEVAFQGEPDQKLGWFLDYSDVKELVSPLVDKLDHYLLNEIPGLENPTSEVLAAWLLEHLTREAAWKNMPAPFRVTVSETCTTSCTVWRNPGS